MFLTSFSAKAQVKDLIITRNKDTLFCKIIAADAIKIKYQKETDNTELQIERDKVKKYIWNTAKVKPHCESGFVITNSGQKISGELFINTNSHGMEINRPFENIITNVYLKNESSWVYNIDELKGFYYCDTMYMRIQTTDSSYQFVQLLESGKNLILAKGVNTDKYKWRDPYGWKTWLYPNKGYDEKNTELTQIHLDYVRIKLVSRLDDPLINGRLKTVEYKYAKETYFLIKKGESPIMVKEKKFYEELENLFEDIGELLVSDTKWTEKTMIQAVNIINNQN